MFLITNLKQAFVDGVRDTMRAARRDWQSLKRTVPAAYDAVAKTASETAQGVGDAVYGLIAFPTVVTQYLTGTTEHFGELASWYGFGRHFQFTWKDNTALRFATVINHTILGGADLLSGHLLYGAAEAVGIQEYTPWFSPCPTDVRGFARDLATGAALVAMPTVKAKGYALLGIPEKAVPVSETPLARQLASATQARAEAALQKNKEGYRRAAKASFNQWMSIPQRGTIVVPLPDWTKSDYVTAFRQTTVSDADLRNMCQHTDVNVARAARQVLVERTASVPEGFVLIPGGELKGQDIYPFAMKTTPITNAQWFQGLEGRRRIVTLRFDPRSDIIQIDDISSQPPASLSPMINLDTGRIVVEGSQVLLKLVDNPSAFYDVGGRVFSGAAQPTINVTKYHVLTWLQVQKLWETGDRVCRLPTDLQFEYVASDAGTKLYATENGKLYAADGRRLAHFDDRMTASVDDPRYGQQLPFGVQAIGNAWRWTEFNPLMECPNGIRAGSWSVFDPAQMRADFRNDYSAHFRYYDVGFQPVFALEKM